MRIVLAGLLFGLLVLATKADEPVETEYEDPVEELNDLVDWEVEDDDEEKPTSVEVSSLIIVLRIPWVLRHNSKQFLCKKIETRMLISLV